MKKGLMILAGIVIGVAALLLVVWLGAHLFTANNQYARAIAWLDSDVKDYQKFPSRAVNNAPPVFNFRQPTDEEAQRYAGVFESYDFEAEGERFTGDFEDFMDSSNTTSFLVIKDDALLYEGYFNSYDRESTVTSFSMAKSFVSALAGIAIDEGYIDSVEDPITKYVPELLEVDQRYEQITIRHLLSMSSGIRYEESSLPWTDDATTYYNPNLRKAAVSSPIAGEPQIEFLYNNYHPLLMGLVLERTTGRPVAQYLEEKIWQPLGMEAPGSWSLDSEQHGFEKMESGINGKAIDFAKFGRLFLRNGDWDGEQVISADWVDESTRLDTGTDPADHYQYFWWVDTVNPSQHQYYAAGKHGQYIYIVPDQDLVMVRFGINDRFRLWPELFNHLAEEIAAR